MEPMDYTHETIPSQVYAAHQSQCPDCSHRPAPAANALNPESSQVYSGGMADQSENDQAGQYLRRQSESGAQSFGLGHLTPLNNYYHNFAPLPPRASDSPYGNQQRHGRYEGPRGYAAMPLRNEQLRASDPFGGAFSNQLDGHEVHSQLLGNSGAGGIAGPNPWPTQLPQLVPNYPSNVPAGFEYPNYPLHGRRPYTAQNSANEADPSARATLAVGSSAGELAHADVIRSSRLFRDRTNGYAFTASERRPNIGWDSDEDGSILEAENELLRRDYGRHQEFYEEDERYLAAMRGVLSGGKRLPSKETIASLETVKVEDLPENDKTCIICYNEFGISNPEGITEQAIRLPKCKHLFGDKCIKKWFEDSDSCPYCRDKLPSELVVKRSGLESTMRAMQRERRIMQQSRQTLTPSTGSLAGDPNTGRFMSSISRMSREEYEEFMMSRQNNPPWSGSPPNRHPGESPERRRQARSRVGNGRPGHFSGRPASVGSARSLVQSYSHYQVPSHRGPFGLPNPAPPHVAGTMTPANRTMPRPSTTTQDSYSGDTPSPVSSASSEEASPAVAVGSGFPSQPRIFPFRSDWRPTNRQHTTPNRPASGYYINATSNQQTSTGGGNPEHNIGGGDGAPDTTTARPRWSR